MFKILDKLCCKGIFDDESNSPKRKLNEEKVAPPSRYKPGLFCSDQELAARAELERANRKEARAKRSAAINDPIREKYGISKSKR